MMKFDVVFSNPPYNSNVDIKILNEIIDVAEEFVIVHPSTWILDLKSKSNLYKEFLKKVEGKVESLEFFNGNPIFDIGLYVPCLISHFRTSDTIKVKYFNTNYSTESLENITKFETNWETMVKPFYSKVIKYIRENNGSVWSNSLETIQVDNSKFYCQIAGIRGHVNLSSNSSDMVKDDFYTMILKDCQKNKGIRKIDSGGATLEFDSENELDNFISYLKTDFARFCLALLKNKSDLHRGELEIVPWLDFNEEWDDEKLFEKFEVSQELQDYILDFLPDYYGIRK